MTCWVQNPKYAKAQSLADLALVPERLRKLLSQTDSQCWLMGSQPWEIKTVRGILAVICGYEINIYPYSKQKQDLHCCFPASCVNPAHTDFYWRIPTPMIEIHATQMQKDAEELQKSCRRVAEELLSDCHVPNPIGSNQ